MSWAAKRRLIYISIVLIPIIVIGAIWYLASGDPPSCFDGVQNGDETGIDCGGSCPAVCQDQVGSLFPQWARVFHVTDDVYNAVAFFSNPNTEVKAQEVPYSFKVYDGSGILITEARGRANIPPRRQFAIFEDGIRTGERAPARTTFEFLDPPFWVRADAADNVIRVENVTLERFFTSPRLDADIRNTSLEDLEDVEAVAVVQDIEGNAINASRTFVEELPAQSARHITYTWPQGFDIPPSACFNPVDTALLIDVSGSMNDAGDDPPQPISDVKAAAEVFVSNMTDVDTISLVTFATGVSVPVGLTEDVRAVRAAVDAIVIDPEEERGRTNIADALVAAEEQLRNAPSGERRERAVVLLTDGRANQPTIEEGEARALQAAQQIRARGVHIHTIGLGDDINTSFLRSLSGGEDSFYRAPTTASLGDIYTSISRDLCTKRPAVIDIIIGDYAVAR